MKPALKRQTRIKRRILGLKEVSRGLTPGAAMTHLCPYCKKSELLLVSETTDAVGKKRLRYKCPRCGATWPF